MWFALAGFVVGVFVGALAMNVMFLRPWWRAFHEHEAKIDRANDELDARIKRGCRRTDGAI